MLPYPFKAINNDGHYLLEKSVSAKEILQMANYLAKQFLKKGTNLTSPERCFAYLQTILQDRDHEVFGVIFLDQQHRIICYEELFRGTVNQANVYPREIAKLCIQFNAAAVILFHNHPSGMPQPSKSDISLTKRVKEALTLFEVRTLDHVVIGREGNESLSKLGHL